MQKTRNNILLLTIAFCLVACAASAQPVSGYQGKRFIVKTDLIKPVLNGNFGMDAEFIAGRSLILGINTSGFSRKFSTADVDSGLTSYRYAELYFKKFEAAGVHAPLGIYYKYGMGYGRHSASWVKPGSWWTPSTYYSDYGFVITIFSGLGYQRVFARRVVVDASAEYGLRMITRLGEYRERMEPVRFSPEVFSINSGYANSRSWYANASLGIGVLLF